MLYTAYEHYQGTNLCQHHTDFQSNLISEGLITDAVVLSLFNISSIAKNELILCKQQFLPMSVCPLFSVAVCLTRRRGWKAESH